jgi:hypothetical protein
MTLSPKATLVIIIVALIGFSFLLSADDSQDNVIDTVQPPPVQAVQAATPTVKSSQSNQECNPNYSGCLLPDAGDYDCRGGSGNGPYYTGRVQVLGYDQYDLDRDGDGWGCE